LGTLLYGVIKYDLVSFVTRPALLADVALAAGYLPARRAASPDPLRVLPEG
jgi:ABC-type lipoprotein release transport system permease subunit